MLSAEDNELLTRTGAGTPMGELFRRFWVPVLLSEELPEPDGAPLRLKILGEDLLAFRATDGRVGLVAPRCSHRGAELFFGRNEDCGLRCVYHGWKFDLAGACVDAPTMRSDDLNERFRAQAAITAYPTAEAGDLVWAYLGPPEHQPPLPDLELLAVAPAQRYAGKKLQEANWAQLVEGAIDTAHFSFLHMPVTVAEAEVGTNAGGVGGQQVRWMKNDPRPVFNVVDHDAGFVLGGGRRADGEDRYWRITQFLQPNHSLAPGTMAGMTYSGQTWVPVDDETTWVFCYSWNPDRDLRPTERGFHRGVPSIYSEIDEHYRPVRNRDNDYGIDRKAQKTDSYSGIEGISEQDAAMQESQGRIADRTKELLGPTDIGVIRFRRSMIAAARALTEGVEPPAASSPAAYRVRSGGIVIDAAVPFDEVLEARFAGVREQRSRSTAIVEEPAEVF